MSDLTLERIDALTPADFMRMEQERDPPAAAVKKLVSETDYGRNDHVQLIISIPGKTPAAVGVRWLEERLRLWEEDTMTFKGTLSSKRRR